MDNNNLPKTMKALVLHDVAKLTLDEVAVPELTEGCVLVKIKACGICSSDIERVFVNGTYHFPTIPGHEFSGEIVALGEGVDEALLGKRTCVFPLLPCKKCKACEMEEYAQCSSYSYFGSRQDGGFAEYLVVPVWNLVPFDDSIPYEVAALCEPSAVSMHAVNIADVKAGQKVAVLGTGAIGFIIASFAKGRGADVTVCGRSQNKIDYAKKLGFHVLNTAEEDFVAKANELSGNGYDVVIEAVGSNDSIEKSVAITGALGKVVLVGNPKDDLHMEKNVYWSILRKQLTVRGSWNSNYNSKINDWAAALEAFKNSDFDFAQLITHTYPMDEFEKGFDVLRDKDVFTLKVMYTMD